MPRPPHSSRLSVSQHQISTRMFNTHTIDAIEHCIWQCH
jgi:hypothetical protein